MRVRTLAAFILAPSILFAVPALGATIIDPTDDFLPSYTAGPELTDLDVTSFSVDYDSAAQLFTLGATFAGDINPSSAGLYVVGVNTGTGTIRPLALLGQPNVVFNQAIVISKDGTGVIGGTSLDPSSISIAGNVLTASIPLALLPSTGFAPNRYGFNLWPRIALGSNDQITDFAPDNATLAAVPEPGVWTMMMLGFGTMGAALRYRRRGTGAAVTA